MEYRCPACHGEGKCAECFGTGTNTHLNDSEPKCRKCQGSGVCPECQGTGSSLDWVRRRGIADLGSEPL